MSSDDSDFYGDDEVVTGLKSRVRNFNVDSWWEDHEKIESPLKLQARRLQELMMEGPDSKRSHLHNPYAGIDYAWQLTETVDEFLDRVPPATTDETEKNSWIWICNPYIDRKSKSDAENQSIRGGEDEAPEEEGALLHKFMEGAQERLDFASEFIRKCKKSGSYQAHTSRECTKAGSDARKDILMLAKQCRVTCGKWMIFCSVFQVNEVWGEIANATANNELGIAAKVAPRSTADKRKERLICVYTADFTDAEDVKRVAQRLKELGVIAPRGKPLYYKPDALTYLGIAHQNPWAMKASIYDSSSVLRK